MTTGDHERTDAGDALAERARDIASAGLVVAPLLAHLYSIALLLRLRCGGLPVSYKGRKAARDAWNLNVAMLFVAVMGIGLFVAVYFILR